MHSMHFLSQASVDLQLLSPLSWKTTNVGTVTFYTTIVRDQLYQLNIHKSMGPHGIHPSVLKEPVNVIGRTPLNHLSKILEV